MRRGGWPSDRVGCLSMSHHRETVTADGRARRRRPLLARRQVQRPRLLLRPDAARPGDRQARRGRRSASRRARCLENLAIVAAAAGAQLADAVRWAIYVTDMCDVQGRQRGLRHATSSPTRRRASTIGVAALPLGAEVEIDADHRPPGLSHDVTRRRRSTAARRRRSRRVARRTPVLSSRTISERAGGIVALKAENLQRTGSFKVRGAAAKLAALGEDGCARGVVAASAGNHAQALAAAARAARRALRGLRARRRADGQGGGRARAGRDRPRRRRLASTSASSPRTRAASEGGLAFVHPFDDPDDRRRARDRSGSSCSRTCPTSPRSSCRSAAAGCASGVAIAIKSARPGGRGRSACRSRPARPTPSRCGAASRCPPTSALTIADGIAVKRPGELTLAAARATGSTTSWSSARTRPPRRWSLLMERCKLVVEGAGRGRRRRAARRPGARRAATGTTVAVLSGGNVDAGLLASIARRARDARPAAGSCCSRRVPDRPGQARRAARLRRRRRARNIVDVSHVREGVDLHVRETAVELVLETRGQSTPTRSSPRSTARATPPTWSASTGFAPRRAGNRWATSPVSRPPWGNQRWRQAHRETTP